MLWRREQFRFIIIEQQQHKLQQQHIQVFKWIQFKEQSEKQRQCQGLPKSEGKAQGRKGK